MCEVANVRRRSDTLITGVEYWNSDTYVASDAGAMSVATVIAVIAIKIATWRAVFMGVKVMTKFLLVRRIVAVWISVHHDIRSGLQAHEEHRENHEMANERSHNGASVTQNRLQKVNRVHIGPVRIAIPPAPIG